MTFSFVALLQILFTLFFCLCFCSFLFWKMIRLVLFCLRYGDLQTLVPWTHKLSYHFLFLAGRASLDYISGAHIFAKIWPVQTLQKVSYILIWPYLHASYLTAFLHVI